MRDELYYCQIVRRILDGMGTEHYYCERNACFFVDWDLWRVEIDPSEPDQVCLSFAQEMVKEDAVRVAMRFYAIASMLDLGILHVISHKRGDRD